MYHTFALAAFIKLSAILQLLIAINLTKLTLQINNSRHVCIPPQVGSISMDGKLKTAACAVNARKYRQSEPFSVHRCFQWHVFLPVGDPYHAQAQC
jgi:hypothetical protein